MERQVPPDPLALLDSLEREESKDSPDLLASRVCPDLLAPLVRVASLVMLVFLERVARLALLDPEESVVSQEREAALGLRVCRDPVVFLELPERTAPRVPLDQLAQAVPRDPPACRECPEREDPAASQDLRETEVTMVRRDLKEPLAKTVEEA